MHMYYTYMYIRSMIAEQSYDLLEKLSLFNLRKLLHPYLKKEKKFYYLKLYKPNKMSSVHIRYQ